MKKLIMVFLLLLTSCQQNFKSHTPFDKNKELKVVITNDLHYAHSSMIGNHEKSRELTLKADGKQLNYLDVITESFIADMKELKPDVIILNGDLVYNGEKENHKQLSKLLYQLDSLVLVNPGNHDIDSEHAIQISETESKRVESISQEEFESIYKNFGYYQASSRDKDSLSYKIEVSDSLDILIIDTHCDASCDSKNNGIIKESTLKWIEKELIESNTFNKEVIFVSHHNPLIHYQRLNKGFTIDDNKRIINLLEKYNVKLALSGHIHVQHFVKENNLVDIATQSLAVFQNQVGVITYTPKTRFHYQTRMIDISKYHQGENTDLINFNETAFNTIKDVNTRRTAFKLFDEYSMDNEDNLIEIAEFAGIIKAYYFSGQLHEKKNEILNHKRFKELYSKYPFEMSGLLDSIKIFGDQDYREIEIQL